MCCVSPAPQCLDSAWLQEAGPALSLIDPYERPELVGEDELAADRKASITPIERAVTDSEGQ
jgi:hypothetical protein